VQRYGLNLSAIKQKTGYLKIIEFTPKTAERVQNALDSFKEAGFTSLIIDLRNNPGGLITSAADVADKFIDKGVIVSTKSRLMFENSVYRASEKATVMPKDIPIIVLINRGSASASEIVAGALKDYHLAYLVGEKTYGKGSVQQVVPLPNSDGIKLTMARYYTPSDSNIDKVGIPPDAQVLFPALTEEEEKTFASLVTDGVISKYVEAHPHMSDNDIVLYAQRLADTYKLEERVLRRLVKMEVNRTKPADLYDLDYDVQLKAALKMFNNSDFGSLVKSAKTLKELQAVSVAGTGKTYVGVALAVKALKEKQVRRIILTRPAVEAGENLGFLPGDLKEKLDPYMQPLYDALRDMIPHEKLNAFIEAGIIEIAPLAFMRGRTLDNAFVILDEAQNTTHAQMKMFLTRMGRNAKFMITGDPGQIDLPRKVSSGLKEAMLILQNVQGIAFLHLDDKDVVRHPLVRSIIEAYKTIENNE